MGKPQSEVKPCLRWVCCSLCMMVPVMGYISSDLTRFWWKYATCHVSARHMRQCFLCKLLLLDIMFQGYQLLYTIETGINRSDIVGQSPRFNGKPTVQHLPLSPVHRQISTEYHNHKLRLQGRTLCAATCTCPEDPGYYDYLYWNTCS